MGKALMQQPAGFSGIRFTVGRDQTGCWIVQDRDGLVGGIFRDRASAVHFALFESDHQPGAVCCVPDGVMVSKLTDDGIMPGGAAADRASLRMA
jgi:hypothetical protein